MDNTPSIRARSLATNDGGIAFLECALLLGILASCFLGIAALGDFLTTRNIVATLCSDGARSIGQPEELLSPLKDNPKARLPLALRASQLVSWLEVQLKSQLSLSLEPQRYRIEVRLDPAGDVLAATGTLPLKAPGGRGVEIPAGLRNAGFRPVLVRIGVTPPGGLRKILGLEHTIHYEERTAVVLL